MKRALLLVVAFFAIAATAHAASPYLDSSFGSGGIAQISSAPDIQTPVPLELASGRIAMIFGADWAQGSSVVGTIYYLARYDRTGKLDTTFGSAGLAEVGRFSFASNTPSYFPTKMSEDSSGRILVSGQQADVSGNSPVAQFVLERFTANGAVDASFATNGTGVWSMAAVGLTGTSVVDHYDLANGRKLIAADGSFTDANGFPLAPRSVFLVVTANGSLDTSFAGTGWFQVDYVVSGVRVAGDGTFSASGIASRVDDINMNFVTAKYSGSGSAVGSRTSFAVPWRAVAFQRDGSYVTFPDTSTMEVRDFSGNVDTLFGDGGTTKDGVDLNYHYVARTPDGGVVTTLFQFDDGVQGYRATVCVWRATGENDSCDTALDKVDPGPGLAMLAPSGALFVTGSLVPNARVARLAVTAPNIEYFNSTLGHYFVTYDGEEARTIDAGAAGPNWKRTGVNSFKSGGTTPVCRFFGTPGIGSDSHFFTISAQECEQVKKDPGWTFEGYGFYATPAVNGACESPLKPVYRLYNNRAAQRDSNHRHITDLSLASAMTSQGWSLEGVAFCTLP